MLKQNKSFQFLVGAFVLFLAWKCYTLGIFDFLWADENAEGFESVNLLALVATAAVSAVQLVGVCAILIVSGLVIGLASLGVNIIKQIGMRLSKITPSRGLCIELGAAIVVLVGYMRLTIGDGSPRPPRRRKSE